MSDKPLRRDVLLIAADRDERRLLFGELLESGYDVVPIPEFERALGELLQHLIEPRLFLIDVGDDEELTPQAVDYLLKAAGIVPVILLVGTFNRAKWESLGPRLDALLCRPIAIGAIVEAVKGVLPISEP